MGLALDTTGQMTYNLIVIASSLLLVLRRLQPEIVLALLGTLLVVHVIVVKELTIFAGVICLIAAYTTQTQLTATVRRVYAVAIYSGAGAATFRATASLHGDGWQLSAARITAVLTMVTVAVLAGIIRRDRRTRYEDALNRAAILEARRDAERRLAAIEERGRIAREMHDVLGHCLNSIAMQAEGARYAVKTDPATADQMLSGIARLSRDAANDIRGLVSVLAVDDTPPSPHPAPALADIPDLISNFDHTGTPIRLHVTGELDQVVGPVGLAGYRIVQESLTNIVKHASGAAVTVRVSVQDDRVELLVLNGPTDSRATQPDSTPGRGILGMQERARALGGVLHANRDPDSGGWLVTATLGRRTP